MVVSKDELFYKNLSKRRNINIKMNIIRIADKNFENLWNDFFKKIEFLKPFHTTLFKEYQKEYLRLKKIIDISFLVCDKNIVVAGINASVLYSNNKIELSNFGLPLTIYYLEDSFESKIIQKVIIKEIEDIINNRGKCP